MLDAVRLTAGSWLLAPFDPFFWCVFGVVYRPLLQVTETVMHCALAKKVYISVAILAQSILAQAILAPAILAQAILAQGISAHAGLAQANVA